MTSDSADLQDLYQAGQERHLAAAEALGARSRLLSNLRGVTFAALAIALGYFFLGQSQVAGAVAAAAAVAFFVLIGRHARVIEAEDHERRLALVNEHARARVEGRAAILPETGEGLVAPEHPYAGDLDLFGKGSLYQRLSTAHTHFGTRRLSSWLADFAAPDEVQARQLAVEELAPQLGFRQELEAQALALSEKRRDGRVEVRSSPDPEPLLRWIEAPTVLLNQPLLLVASFLLPATTVTGIVWHSYFGGTPFHWLVPLALGMLLLGRTQRETSAAFAAVSTTEGAFLRYGELLSQLEGLQVKAPWLTTRRALLSESERPAVPASQTMRRFRRLVGWYDLRHNGMVYPLIDALLLWDIHCTLQLERWKRDVGTRARAWFQVIGEFEAISSLSGFRHDEPESSFPTLAKDGELAATGLGHPLIQQKKRVSNDLAALTPGQALLVTGSNMSGKSTFLRALGTNTVLAFAGAPVTATSLSLPLCVLGTSIRVSDSLLSGTSHFFAEVKKLAHVVELSRGPVPVLFLMDEVLHGTNSRERQLGARWVLAELLQSNALGILTTHDEGLCELPDALMPRVRQHHFRENVAGGAMTFDYQLRPGPVTSGNALRLMRQVGLDVPLPD